MDIRAYLTELGVAEADQKTYLENPALLSVLEKSATKYESGSTALTAAQAAKADAERKATELNEWWKNTAQPAILESDSERARSAGEAARYQTYLKSMKDQGYQVPDEYFTAATVTPPANTPPNGNYITAQDFQRQTETFSDALAELVDVSNEHQALFGSPLTKMREIFNEAKTQRKGVRQYVEEKFDYSGKKAAMAAAEKAKWEAATRTDERNKVLAEEAAKKNPNLAPAISSKATAVVERNKGNENSWQTRKGRDEARRDRLDRFANVKAIA